MLHSSLTNFSLTKFNITQQTTHTECTQKIIINNIFKSNNRCECLQQKSLRKKIITTKEDVGEKK